MIRDYCSNDWEAVREIYDRAKPEEMRGFVPADSIVPLNLNPTMVALFNESTVLLFEIDGAVAGFGGYKDHTVTYLYVHPEHRRKGVASWLLKAMLRALGGNATLNVARMNIGAYELYSRMGFVIESEFVGQYNGFPCDVARMRYS